MKSKSRNYKIFKVVDNHHSKDSKKHIQYHLMRKVRFLFSTWWTKNMGFDKEPISSHDKEEVMRMYLIKTGQMQAQECDDVTDDLISQYEAHEFNNTYLEVNGIHFRYPKKHSEFTAILEFEVIKPQHELETVGERLKLSMFGEYCPDQSMRGYQLSELLEKNEHYRPTLIIERGKLKHIN